MAGGTVQGTNAWSQVLAGGFSPVPSTAGTGEGLLLQALLPPQHWEMSPLGTQAPMGGFGAEFLLSPCSSWPCKKQLSLGLCLHGSGAHGESCSWPSAINSSLCQENILREETTPEGVNGGVAGAVRAAARAPIPSHPIPSHPIPSHPIPSHPIPSALCAWGMASCFLEPSCLYKTSSKHTPGSSRARQSSRRGGSQLCVLQDQAIAFMLLFKPVSPQQPWRRALLVDFITTYG